MLDKIYRRVDEVGNILFSQATGHPVRFVYLDDEDEELDREYNIKCQFLPRVGDRFLPAAGDQVVEVVRVIHKPVRFEEGELGLILATTVCLKPLK